jgi:pimeloyl-ACP methyl ester carboxylesterase
MKRFIFKIFALILSLSASAQFQIGRTTITFNDPTRTGGFGSGGGPGRQIQTEIYYPANTAGVNVAVANGEFPVITFGHGFAMSWDAYQNIWEELVPRGYIMAFPRTEGSLIPAPSHSNFGLDIALVNERMLAFNNNQSSLFFNKISPKSAIAGHSMGGGASFLAANNNTNIATVIGFAPAETNPSAVAAAPNVSVPTLVFSGSADGVTPAAEHHTPIYNATGSSCKYFVNIVGGAHCYYANTNFNCDFGEGTSSPNISITRAQQQQTTYDVLNPWLDYILKGQCNELNTFQNILANDSRITSITECDLEQPIIQSSAGSVLCEGSSTVLSVPNGSSNLTWSTGATGATLTVSQAGSYTVYDEVSCQQSAEFVLTTIPLPDAPQITANGAVEFCEGESVSLSTTTQGLITWSTGATGTSITVNTSGNYNATVSNNGCVSLNSNTINVIVNPNPTPIITQNQQGNLEAGVQGTNYQWFFNGTEILNSNSFSITPQENGIYKVIVTDANGCVGESAEFEYEKLSIASFDSTYLFQIFPNPATDFIQIQIEEESMIGTEISIVNLQGKIIQTNIVNQLNFVVNVNDLQSGVYFVKIGNFFKKVIVN